MVVPHDVLRKRLRARADVVESTSMFGHGDAFWVGGKEIAHFATAGFVELRLTRDVIRRQRESLEADGRVTLRPRGSDWVRVRLESARDADYAEELFDLAAEVHQPPAGVDLELRRRFH